MDLENINITIISAIAACVSAIAACVSVFFAMRLQKFHKKVIKNKLALEIVCDLISQLQRADAMKEHALKVSDDEFKKSIDLGDVPLKIAKLIQHDQISEKIKMEEWNDLTENLPDKIAILIKIRDNLL